MLRTRRIFTLAGNHEETPKKQKGCVGWRCSPGLLINFPTSNERPFWHSNLAAISCSEEGVVRPRIDPGRGPSEHPHFVGRALRSLSPTRQSLSGLVLPSRAHEVLSILSTTAFVFLEEITGHASVREDHSTRNVWSGQGGVHSWPQRIGEHPKLALRMFVTMVCAVETLVDVDDSTVFPFVSVYCLVAHRPIMSHSQFQ